MNRMFSHRPRQGFTLIELLVVIAIIAILAAILFPVFAQAREKARAIACISNLKQAGLAVTQYEQDYDERTPCGLSSYGSGVGWAGQAYPYVKSVNVFKCPDDSTQGQGSSYGLNSNVVIPPANQPAGCGDPNEPPNGASLAQFNSPAKTVLLFEVTGNYDIGNPLDITKEAQGGGTCNGSPAGYGTGYSYDPNGTGDTAVSGSRGDGRLKYATGDLPGIPAANQVHFVSATGRHTEGANYLMADNHAKFFRPGAISPGVNAASETAAQEDGGVAAGTGGTFSNGTTQPAATFSLQ